MTVIEEKLRNILQDNYTLIPSDVQEYYGGAKIFTLVYANIDAATLIVYKNGAIWANTNYSYSATTGKVTVTGTLTAGDVLTFQYNAYEKYSSNELRGYIRSALYHLTVEKYKTFTAKSDNVIFPTPSEAEESLIAIVAAILVKGNIRQYRTPEFTIIFDTDNLSQEKKIRQTLRQFKKSFGASDYIDLNNKVEVPEDN